MFRQPFFHVYISRMETEIYRCNTSVFRVYLQININMAAIIPSSLLLLTSTSIWYIFNLSGDKFEWMNDH